MNRVLILVLAAIGATAATAEQVALDAAKLRLMSANVVVLDAGDGSGNFVGLLRAYGARIVLDDRNSGSTVILDDLSAAPLRPYVGLNVLVIGHLTASGYVVPVAFRVLAPITRSTSTAGQGTAK